MSDSQDGDRITLPASTDLSSKQFLIMSLDSDGKAQLAPNAAVHPIGVLMNKPDEEDKTAEVKTTGTFDVIMIENCDEGEMIVADNGGSGKGEVADAADEFGIGIALAANTGGDGTKIQVLMQLGIVSIASEA